MNKRIVSFSIDLLFATLGILGTMGCFLKMYPLPIMDVLVMVIMMVTTFYFFYVFASERNRKKWLKLSCIVYVLIAVATFFIWKDGLAFIMNTMFSTYEQNSQYSFNRFAVHSEIINATYIIYLTLWLIFTPVCAIIVRTLKGQHSYFLGFVVTVPFLFSILLFTLRPNPLYFHMVLIFWFALAGMGTAGHFKVYNFQYTIQKMGALFAISSCVILLFLNFFFPESSYVRDPNIESFRVSIQTKIRELIDKSYDQEAGELDLCSAGNRFYIDSSQFKVSMSDPRTLYLHGYSGAFYNNNKWSNGEFSNQYPMGNMSVVHPFNFALLEAGNLSKTSVNITYLENKQMYLYTPYYLLDDLRDRYNVKSDVYIERGELEEGATYSYQMAVLDGIDKTAFEPQKYQRDYYDMVKDTYLNVPMPIKNLLGHFYIEGLQDAQTQEEKISIIQSFMTKFGTYTLSPGSLPSDVDFIEYFLTQNKEGYCVHYATAATMILRYNGIPARYASGYYIDKGYFKNGEAIVKDYQEHAWVEILDPVFGWIPLEVTPTSGGTIQNPATNPDAPNQNPNTPTPNPNNPTPNNPTPDKPTNNEGQDPTITQASDYLKFIGLGCVVVLLVGILQIRRKYLLAKHKRALQQQDPRLAIVYCGAYLERNQCLDDVDPSIQVILQEAKYSNHPMDEAARSTVVTYCTSFIQAKYAIVNKRQRFLYRYIYVYY